MAALFVFSNKKDILKEKEGGVFMKILIDGDADGQMRTYFLREIA